MHVFYAGKADLELNEPSFTSVGGGLTIFTPKGEGLTSRPNRSYRAYFLSYYFSKVRHGFCLICSGANDYPGEVLAYFLSYYFSKVHPGENPGENPVNATLY